MPVHSVSQLEEESSPKMVLVAMSLQHVNMDTTSIKMIQLQMDGFEKGVVIYKAIRDVQQMAYYRPTTCSVLASATNR